MLGSKCSEDTYWCKITALNQRNDSFCSLKADDDHSKKQEDLKCRFWNIIDVLKNKSKSNQVLLLFLGTFLFFLWFTLVGGSSDKSMNQTNRPMNPRKIINFIEKLTRPFYLNTCIDVQFYKCLGFYWVFISFPLLFPLYFMESSDYSSSSFFLSLWWNWYCLKLSICWQIVMFLIRRELSRSVHCHLY